MSCKLDKITVRTLLKLTVILTAAALLWGCTRTQTLTQSETIPYKSTKIDDPALVQGVTKVKQAGIPGLRQAVFKEKYSGDELLSRDKVGDKLIDKPVNEIVQVGTAPPVTFSVIVPGGAFELSISSCGRKDQIAVANKPVNGDFLLITGILKNTGAKAAKTGNFLDLAAINAAIKGGLSYLVISAPPQLLPGQSVNISWSGSINPGANSRNAAIATAGQVQVIPRALVGAKNKLGAPPKPLTGLAEN